MQIDPLWFRISSDLLVNLAAGLFGAAYFTYARTSQHNTREQKILMVDIVQGMLLIVLAFYIGKEGGL